MIIEKRDYYNHGKIEAIDAIESACTGLSGFEGFLTGTVLKYLFRWRWKGTSLADLKKARYYLDRLIADEKKKLGVAESMPEHFEQDRSAMAGGHQVIHIRLLIMASITLSAAVIAAVCLAYGIGRYQGSAAERRACEAEIHAAESMPEQSATSSPSGTEH